MGGGVRAASFRAAPAATRWRALNWPWRRRLAVLAGYFAVVNWLLFAPASAFEEVPLMFDLQDKLAHVSVFLALAVLVRWSLPAGAARGGYGGWVRFGAPAALALYTCAAEAIQPLVGGAGRQFEWLDMASNMTGIGAGWVLYGAAIAGAKDGCTGASEAATEGRCDV